MTTNQTIYGVRRELLQKIADGGYCHQGLMDELRALLDAADHVHEWDINAEGTATVCHCGARSSNEPAEQPALVAVVMPERSNAVVSANVSAKQAYALGWNACLDEVARLNAAQPVPVAAALPVDPERERLMEIVQQYPNVDPLKYDAAVRTLRK